MDRQLEAQKVNAMKQGHYSLHEIELYFRLEYQLFDSPFASKFKLPKKNLPAVQACINQNINFIMKNIFDPNTENTKPSFSGIHERMNPNYNKFFKELGAEKISPLECPVESIFLVLSKIHWNSKLKLAKTQKIALTCLNISKEETIHYFDTDADLEFLEKQQKKRNLDSLDELFREFFERMVSHFQ